MPEIVSSPLTLAIWAALGYLLGSVPFGVIIARAMNLGDLRKIGSGNIGATNVLRTGNKLAAFLTLVLDGGKGAAAVLIARAFALEDAVMLAGFASFLGHCFPVWLGFKGGKGVATFIGLSLAVAWPVGLLVCATWLAVAFILGYSSLSALTAAALSPLYSYLTGYGDMVLLFIALAALIYIRHAQNISRLLAGQETKIGKKG